MPDTSTLEQSADTAMARGDLGSALSALEQLVLEAPSAARWTKLAAARRVSGRAPAAIMALDEALKLSPLDFTALLMRAHLLEGGGKRDEAALGYGRALAQLAGPVPPGMAGIVEHARRFYRKWQDIQQEELRGRAESVGALTPNVDRLISNAVRLSEPDRIGPTHYCYPDLPEVNYFEPEQFPWASDVEAATPLISNELRALLSDGESEKVPYVQYPDHAPLEQWAYLNRNTEWTAIHLLQRGQQVSVNAKRCPVTLSLLAKIPQPHVQGAGGNAMFSLLAPHTHIPPHHGITNTRLVCHLPLVVPENCWFRVGVETRRWEIGKLMVFDDSIEHEAMNDSDELRVILIFDIWHPALSEIERKGTAAVIAGGGKIHAL